MSLRGRINRRSFVTSIGLASAALSPFAGYSASRGGKPHPRETILVFDVADTLLNIQALGRLFERIFGNTRVAGEWFGQSILYAETLTITGSFVPFGRVSQGILRMLAKIHGARVTAADEEELRQRLSVLPPHADVAEGLDRLNSAGFRMVTLTNTPATPDAGPSAKAGLSSYFERHFSAEAVLRFKPALQTYQMVADELGCSTRVLCMVAAHPWDLIGAQSAGCSAALLARAYVAALPLEGSPRPTIVGKDLVDVADQLTAGSFA
jgi:2-haloacid dehalogenase